CLGEDHFTNCFDSDTVKEHMFGTAKTDTLSTKSKSLCSILWSICIGANLQLSCFISPAHQTAKVAGNGSSNGWNCFCVNLTGGAIQGDVIAAADLLAAQLEVTIFIVHYDVAAAGYTAGTHTTSNNCCVRGHTAANGQDALC